MKRAIYIGTSAFNNGYWKGIFYPEDLPRTKWFEYYCKQFNTYELNATFYRFPTVKSLKSWYAKTPDGFLFSVKMHKSITHIKKFEDCRDAVAEFYATVKEGLADKLACVLFQLPPSFDYSHERLELILSYMDPDFKNVIEFRHKSWWRYEVFDWLAKAGVSFCNVSYPKLPTDFVKTETYGYIRLHGVPKLFYSQYTPKEMETLYQEILKKDWEKVLVYFNNTASTAGVLNAVELKKAK